LSISPGGRQFDSLGATFYPSTIIMKTGADFQESGRAEFSVWAPFARNVALRIVSPDERLSVMEKDERGYWRCSVEKVSPGSLYFYRLDGERERPDPASHFQPYGVHGPSQVIDHGSFAWADDGWRGIPLSEMIIYELHTGTFTPEGTFDGITGRLDDLKETGINAIELMPVVQFPGERNWGYDGAYPYAVQNSYGGPEGLKRLVAACHAKGFAVILDVVYNHLGPEGNYLWDFGPYFTEKYKTPWGWAINYDDAWSNEVRNYFIENALHWFGRYHIDALRIDAIHGITDMSARPFLQELAERVEEYSQRQRKKFYLIAESDLNDARVIRPRELGGFGIHAQWNDDFHHCLHTLLTGERDGYYADFGGIARLGKCLREGFVYSGGYSVYRRRNHGNSSKDRPAGQFIVFSQNHDQVGNRMLGERLTGLVSFESLKLAAALTLLSPYIPLLFMGEEYAEDAPFLYFVSHSDAALIRAVREGRKKEFSAFSWKGETPDAQDEDTFNRSKIGWEKRTNGRHAVMLDFYSQLIALRRAIPALSRPDRENLEVSELSDAVLCTRRWRDGSDALVLFNFGSDIAAASVPVDGRCRKVFDSASARWAGPGMLLPEELVSGSEVSMTGRSVAVYRGQGG
jgi:maltooligosyltrehalose trehalohydrolase